MNAAPVKLNKGIQMAKKVIIKINDDAYVEEKNKRITGEYECSPEAAVRLVEKLNVAEYVKIDIEDEDVPDESWKVEDIKAWLDEPEREVKYQSNATKQVLLEAVKTFLEKNNPK